MRTARSGQGADPTPASVGDSVPALSHPGGNRPPSGAPGLTSESARQMIVADYFTTLLGA